MRSTPPLSPPRPRTRHWIDQPYAADILIVAVVLLLAVIYLITAGGNFPLDDGWIHQTYGRNLAQSGEWAFTPGVPSTASTSPLYTVVLAVGYKLGVEGRVWAHLVGALGLVFTGLIGVRMMRHLLPNAPRVAIIGGLAVVGSWHLIWAAFSGMETGLFNLWTLAAIWLCWCDTAAPGGWRNSVWRGARFGLLAGLITLTRAEGVILVGLAGLALLASRRWSFSMWLLYGVCAAVVFGLVLAPYLSFNYQMTGGLLPNTAAAKIAFATARLATPYPERVLIMIEPLLAGGQILLIPGAWLFAALTLGRLRAEPSVAPTLLLFIWPMVLILVYAAWLPLPFQHGRYLIPALPAFILAGVAGVAWGMARWRRALGIRVVLRVLAASSALVFIAFAFVIGLNVYRTDVAIIDQEMVAQSLYIAENVPRDELLVIYDIGAVGYNTSRPLLDMAGLVSPEVIPLIDNPASLWNVIRERDGLWMLAFNYQIPKPVPPGISLCIAHETANEITLIQGGDPMILYRIQYDQPCAPGTAGRNL